MYMPVSIQRIYLIGLMGAGKTTVGSLLAAVLEWRFVDTDSEIEKLVGMDIPEIFKKESETGFRKYETQVLKQTISYPKTVIACGGGIVTQSENKDILNEEVTVWLDLSPAEAAARLEHSINRPLLAANEDTLMQLNEIFNERRDAYANSASIHISSGGLSPEIIASDILKKLEELHD